MIEKLYSPSQAAEILGVTKATVWRWIREGKIKAIVLSSNAYRISESEINRIITA